MQLFSSRYKKQRIEVTQSAKGFGVNFFLAITVELLAAAIDVTDESDEVFGDGGSPVTLWMDAGQWFSKIAGFDV